MDTFILMLISITMFVWLCGYGTLFHHEIQQWWYRKKSARAKDITPRVACLSRSTNSTTTALIPSTQYRYINL